MRPLKADSEAQAQVAAFERKIAMAILAAGHLATRHSATIGCYIMSNVRVVTVSSSAMADVSRGNFPLCRDLFPISLADCRIEVTICPNGFHIRVLVHVLQYLSPSAKRCLAQLVKFRN